MTSASRYHPLDLTAVVLLAAEAVGLLGVAGLYLAHAVRDAEAEVVPTLGIAAFALVMAVGVAAVSRGFARGARWSRGAALTWQVLQAAAAVLMIGALPALGIALLIASAVVAAASMRASAHDAAASASAED